MRVERRVRGLRWLAAGAVPGAATEDRGADVSHQRIEFVNGFLQPLPAASVSYAERGFHGQADAGQPVHRLSARGRRRRSLPDRDRLVGQAAATVRLWTSWREWPAQTDPSRFLALEHSTGGLTDRPPQGLLHRRGPIDAHEDSLVRPLRPLAILFASA